MPLAVQSSPFSTQPPVCIQQYPEYSHISQRLLKFIVHINDLVTFERVLNSTNCCEQVNVVPSSRHLKPVYICLKSFFYYMFTYGYGHFLIMITVMFASSKPKVQTLLTVYLFLFYFTILSFRVAH